MKTLNKFSDGNGNVFRVIATYNPHEENDPWVKYCNESTKQEYNCRLEAFLSRFMPLPD